MANEINFDKINREASSHATKALSKLLDMPIGIDIPSTQVKQLDQLSTIIKLNEKAAGVYLPIIGEVEGASLLVFPEKTVFALCDLLLKKEPGATKTLTALDKSALKEIGNIVIGNYLTVFSNSLHVHLIESLPEFNFSTFDSIIKQAVQKIGDSKMEVLVIEINFTFEPSTIKGHALVFFTMDKNKKTISRWK